MLEMIDNKEYSLIITDKNNILGLRLGLEEAFVEALNQNYEVIKEIDKLVSPTIIEIDKKDLVALR